jgi:hypothetical protein
LNVEPVRGVPGNPGRSGIARIPIVRKNRNSGEFRYDEGCQELLPHPWVQASLRTELPQTGFTDRRGGRLREINPRGERTHFRGSERRRSTARVFGDRPRRTARAGEAHMRIRAHTRLVLRIPLCLRAFSDFLMNAGGDMNPKNHPRATTQVTGWQSEAAMAGSAH